LHGQLTATRTVATRRNEFIAVHSSRTESIMVLITPYQ
jgi:hypothetical protein